MNSKKLLTICLLLVTTSQIYASDIFQKLNNVNLMDLDKYKTKPQVEQEMSSYIEKKQFNEITKLTKKLLKNEKLHLDGRFSHTLYLDTFLYMTKQPRVVSDNYFIDNINEASKWVKQDPKSATGYIYKAFWLRAYAWYIRGGQYTNNTDNKSIQIFANASIENAKFLIQNHDVASADPFYYYILLMIFRDLGLEEDSFNVYKEAIQKFPNHRVIYNTFISNYESKWFGQNYDIVKMVVEDIQEMNPKIKDIYYYHIMFTANNNNYDVTRLDVNWERVDIGAVLALKRMPSLEMIEQVSELYCSYSGNKERLKKIIYAFPKGQIAQNKIEGLLMNCQS